MRKLVVALAGALVAKAALCAAVCRPLGDGVRGWISAPRPDFAERDDCVYRTDFVRFSMPLDGDADVSDVRIELVLLKGDTAALTNSWFVADGGLHVDVSDVRKDGTHYLVDAERSRVSYRTARMEGTDTRPACPSFALPDDDWAGRPRRLAVVNPVTGQDAAAVLSLRGAWDFCLRPYDFAARIHSFHRLAAWPDERKVDVPGCWEAQGAGAATNLSVSYFRLFAVL